MKKLPPLKNLVKKLDDVFQMWVRYRDNFTCITCGKKFPVGERKELHAGHFVSRGIYATRWDEKNVNAQCAACNLKQSFGDVEIIHNYELALEQKYGFGTVEELLNKKHQLYKLKRCDLLDMIDKYEKLKADYNSLPQGGISRATSPLSRVNEIIANKLS